MMIFFMSRTLAPLGTESVICLWPPCEKDVKAGTSSRTVRRRGLPPARARYSLVWPRRPQTPLFRRCHPV